MLEPIVLTLFIDTLIQDKECESRTDNDKIPLSDIHYIGTHKFCSGLVRAFQTSPGHYSIVCKHCCLRMMVPKEIDTYGKLRQWCRQIIESKRLRKPN